MTAPFLPSWISERSVLPASPGLSVNGTIKSDFWILEEVQISRAAEFEIKNSVGPFFRTPGEVVPPLKPFLLTKQWLQVPHSVEPSCWLTYPNSQCWWGVRLSSDWALVADLRAGPYPRGWPEQRGHCKSSTWRLYGCSLAVKFLLSQGYSRLTFNSASVSGSLYWVIKGNSFSPEEQCTKSICKNAASEGKHCN